MKKVIYAATAVAMLSLAACGNNETDAKEAAHEENKENFDKDMKVDTKFAETAADDGMLEVKLSELAATNAFSEDVKALALTMIKDHSAVNDELKGMAEKKNIALPGDMSEGNRETYTEMAGKSGKDFDEAYTDHLVKAHKNAIKNFEKEADKGNDADLKLWASEKLPTLQHHLQMAEELEDKTDDKD